jgi:cbb3-type cytochrome oxidase maturation protein
MGMLLFMIPCSLMVALLFLWLFCRAARDGQFDDLHTPGERVVLEDHIESLQRPEP